MEDQRDRTSKQIKSLSEQVLSKFDRGDQEDMERRIHITIDETKKSLLGQLATKEETTKRLSLLSKKLREVTEILNK